MKSWREFLSVVDKKPITLRYSNENCSIFALPEYEPHHLAACSKELSVSSFLAQVLYKSKSTGSKGESRTLANAIASLKCKKEKGILTTPYKPFTTCSF